MRKMRIGIIGDYNPDFRPHTATNAGISHAAHYLGLQANSEWLPTESLDRDCEAVLSTFDALWCAPGSPYRSMQGALNAIRFAREGNLPFIGTCGGFQHVVVEYARNVLHIAEATHAEYDPDSSSLFISELYCSLVGKRMEVTIKPDSRVAVMYNKLVGEEEYYCTFGLNPAYQRLIDEGGLKIAGSDQDGEARILELPDHHFFIATLFVPQLTSTFENPHPLIVSWLQAAAEVAAANESSATASRP